MSQASMLDVRLLVSTFDSMAAVRGMYPGHACDEAGIARPTMTHVRLGRQRPSIDMVIKMVLWIEGEGAPVDLTPYLNEEYDDGPE